MKQIICAFHCNPWWQKLPYVKGPQTGVWHCAINKKGGAMHRNSYQNIPAKSSWKKRELSFLGMESPLWCCFLWCWQVSDSLGEQLSFLFLFTIFSAFKFSCWLSGMNVVLSVTAEDFISSPPSAPAEQQIPEVHNQWHRVCHQWCPPVLIV